MTISITLAMPFGNNQVFYTVRCRASQRPDSGCSCRSPSCLRQLYRLLFTLLFPSKPSPLSNAPRPISAKNATGDGKVTGWWQPLEVKWGHWKSGGGPPHPGLYLTVCQVCLLSTQARWRRRRVWGDSHGNPRSALRWCGTNVKGDICERHQIHCPPRVPLNKGDRWKDQLTSKGSWHS